MNILETKTGFPDINGYVMHNHIDCDFPTKIMLWFHNHTPDLTSMIHIQVFLLGASMKAANVELDPFFPDVKSCSISEEVLPSGLRKLLHIAFERGEMSFLFQDVFHVRSSHRLGYVPPELKKRMTQK